MAEPGSAPPPGRRAAQVLRWLCAQALLQAGAVLLGFGCFVLLFQTDLWSGVTILFYRGLILLGLLASGYQLDVV